MAELNGCRVYRELTIDERKSSGGRQTSTGVNQSGRWDFHCPWEEYRKGLYLGQRFN